jgi:4-methyl-5(b-hydroxyethyl)-thiazole monophosphate biosynthesis
MFEAAAFIDVLGWADEYGAARIVRVVAASRANVRSTFGLTLHVDETLDRLDLASFDALAIPGGFETAHFYDGAFSPEFLEVIRSFDAVGKPIAAICVAALPVAKSGVLRGRRATTYHLMKGKRRAQLAELGAVVVDAPLVRDDNVTTSTSPATAIDVALDLLATLTSEDNARRIRAAMGFD